MTDTSSFIANNRNVEKMIRHNNLQKIFNITYKLMKPLKTSLSSEAREILVKYYLGFYSNLRGHT